MPHLIESQLMAGTSMHAIPAAPEYGGPSPTGYFVHLRPDTELCGQPPYLPGQMLTERYVLAPIPRSREEVMRYIRVAFIDKEGMPYWEGDWLSDFPGRIKLSELDAMIWRNWLESEETLTVLDGALELCAWQSNYLQRPDRLVSPNSPEPVVRSTSYTFDAPLDYHKKIEIFEYCCERKGVDIPDMLYEWDVHERGLDFVLSKVKRSGYEVLDANWQLGRDPQILAQKADQLYMITVRTGLYPFYGRLSLDEHLFLMEHAHRFDAMPYFAGVMLTNTKARSELWRGIPVRHSRLTLSYGGLTLMVSSANYWLLGDDNAAYCPLV